MAIKRFSSIIFFFLVCSFVFLACKRTIQPPVIPQSILAVDGIMPKSARVQTNDTITGTGFSANIQEDAVYFNGFPASVLSATTTQIIVQIPQQATTGYVTVKVNGASVEGPLFTLLATSWITSIAPTHGIASIRDTIYGHGFSTTASKDIVFYNGVPATVLQADSIRLIVTVPQSTTGLIAMSASGIYVQGPVFNFDAPPDSVIVSTFAGTGVIGYKDGPREQALFSIPWSITFDKHGNLFVADNDSNMIRMINPDGIVSTLPHRHYSPPSGTDVLQLVADDNDSLFITHNNLNKIEEYSDTSRVFAGNGSNMRSDGLGTLAGFYGPNGIAIDKNHNLYVADSRDMTIRKITPDGYVTTLAGSNFGQTGYADGIGAAASFYAPTAVAVDQSGNIYVTDDGNSEVRKVTQDGVVTTLAGHVGGGSTDGMGSAAGFLGFHGIVTDPHGNIYVTDYANHKVRKITPDGVVTTVAGTGFAGYKDGPGSTAAFNEPYSLAIDADGNLYVGDAMNHVIRKITFVH